MDEQALNELLECSVCLDQLDHTSKVLPCQHTFCKRCLEEIVSTKHELRCPECRFLVEMRVDELPTNILLIRLLEGLKTQARAGTSQGRRREAGSPRHTKGNNSVPAASFARQQQQRQGNGSNRPCAKALFNYEGKEPSDLKLKKGDIVYLRKQVDENWFHGEHNGQHGFFPSTYVQVITPLPVTIPQCKGLYDFAVDDNKEGDCLAFKKDETVTVIRKVDDNWLEGKKGDRIGIFPMSFVDLNEPAKILLSLTGKSTSVPGKGPPATPAHPDRSAKEGSPSLAPPSAIPGDKQSVPPLASHNKRHSFSNLPPTVPPTAGLLQRRSLEISSDTNLMASGGLTPTALASTVTTATQSDTATALSLPDVPEPVNKPAPQVPEKATPNLADVNSSKMPTASGVRSQTETASSSTSSHVSSSSLSNTLPSSTSVSSAPIFIALYNYKPQKQDEIELHKGDYYSVSEKCQDGWYKGQCLKSVVSGVFPGNYVQSVKTHSSAFKPVSKPSSSSSSGSKPKVAHASTNSSQPASVPPRPKTSPGRSADSSSRSSSVDRDIAAPPIVPRSSKHASPLQNLASSSSKGHNSSSPVSSSSSPSSPVLSTNHPKTTRYVRASKSISPNIGAKAAAGEAVGENTKSSSSSLSATASGGSSTSPVWKHSMSASAHITPPNVVVGATGKNVPIPNAGTSSGAPATVVVPKEKDKKEKKDKEKISLMKRFASAGKSKKSKSTEVESASLSDSSISHNRSGSFPSESGIPLSEASHKKSGSFDSSSVPTGQPKPTRPKPLTREKFRCIETYPPQSEIELELKVGDIIYVHKKRDDGWYKGTLQRSGKTGLFPGSFAEKLE